MKNPFLKFITTMLCIIVSLIVVNIIVACSSSETVANNTLSYTRCLDFDGTVTKYFGGSNAVHDYGYVEVYTREVKITYPAHMCIVYKGR